MSVDFNECDYCGESKLDDYCYHRVINGKYFCVCDKCISKEVKKKNLIRIADEDDDGYDELTKKEYDLISDYGEIFKYTRVGKAERIKEINKQLELLQNEKYELLNG